MVINLKSNKQNGLFVFLFFMILIMEGCYPYVSNKNVYNPNCIKPIVNSSFPIGTNAQIIDYKNLEKRNALISPIPPWEYVSTVPYDNFSGDGVILIRTIHNKLEIWISGIEINRDSASPSNTSIEENNNSIMIYNVNSDNWTAINGMQNLIIDSRKLDLIQVFTDNENSVWGIGINKNLNPYSISLELLKFDENSKSFFLPNKNDYPNTKYSPNKMIDGNGNFWYEEKKGDYISEIYKFNLQSKELVNIKDAIKNVADKKIENILAFIISAQVEQNGELIIKSDKLNSLVYINLSNRTFYYENINALTFTDFGMYQYIKNNSEEDEVKNDNFVSLGNYLFIDRQENIWVDDYGWKEKGKDGIWYKNTSLSLDFIYVPKEKSIYGPNLFWTRPKPLLNSKDGMIWFGGPNYYRFGLSRFNPQSGDWCMMTTGYVSSILEDENGKLWIYVNNKLYRFNI